MRKLSKKLRSRKGESFAELLVAVLVVAFGCALIASMYAASMSLNLKAKEEDDKYYGSLSDMETLPTDTVTDKKGNFVIDIVDENGDSILYNQKSLDEVQKFGNDDYAAYRKTKPDEAG